MHGRVFVCGRGLNIIGTPVPNTRLRLLDLSRSLSTQSLLCPLSLPSLLSSCKRDMQMGPIVVSQATPPPTSLHFTHTPSPRHLPLSLVATSLTFLCFNPFVQFFKTSLTPFFFSQPLWFYSYTPYYTNTPIRKVVIPPPSLSFALEQCLTSFTFA